MTINIAYSLREVAEKQANKIGLIEANTLKRYTFAQLEKRSDQYAWYLQSYGVKANDKVMLMVRPSIDFICLTFALFKLGSPVILIDPGMGYANLRRCISGVKPKVFIGIPKAHLFSRIFKKSFRTVEKNLCCGFSWGVFGPDLRHSADINQEIFPIYRPDENDLAAIIFTTGSTGPPKGVRYGHKIFSAQLRMIKEHYKISCGDVDQPAFPLFALFSTALGACAVIPDMDASKPAKVNPKKFVDSLQKNRVTYSFGSPALWRVISDYCHSKQIKINSLNKILMAGAPVSGELIAKVMAILPEDAEIHTPYGATECLPIVSIEGKEIIKDTWPLTKYGHGTCVGRPLPGVEIKIVSITEGAIVHLDNDMFLGPCQIGEIIVSGDVVTSAYENNDHENSISKITWANRLWHRMGDVGYLDDGGKLWFCGRKAHRVPTRIGTMFTIPCEAIFNTLPDIYRSALVGIPSDINGFERPVIILEVDKQSKRRKRDILEDVKKIGLSSPLTEKIELFLFNDDFPVDIRHNAKIFREKLKIWAQEKLI